MKKVILIAVAAALLVGITALAYGAAPEKVTGGVETNCVDWKFSFNAHEGTPAKGQLSLTSGSLGWVLHCVVAHVQVEPAAATRDAWFAAKCTKDSGSLTKPSPPDKYKGWWIVIKVHDGGKPKDAADKLGFGWYPTEDAAAAAVGSLAAPMFDVVKGNVVIHPWDEQ